MKTLTTLLATIDVSEHILHGSCLVIHATQLLIVRIVYDLLAIRVYIVFDKSRVIIKLN